MLFSILLSVAILALRHGLSHGAGLNSYRLSTVYECGFPRLGGGRRPAPLLFFLVAILFLLFDMELLALMPVAITSLGPLSGVFLIGFFFILTLGFWVEWRQGALSYAIYHCSTAERCRAVG